MPWPVTHILVAEKFWDSFFSHHDRSAFLIGTCFPDIRYPAQINRELTHFPDTHIADIDSRPSFQAGMHFHSLTDVLWNTYIRDRQTAIFAIVPHNRAMFHTLKILQDRYLYPKGNGWKQVASFFNAVLPEEQGFGIGSDMLNQWHQALAHYLSKPPTIKDIDMLSISLPDEMVSKIRTYYQTYEGHDQLRSILADFYSAIDTYLDKI